MAEPNCPKTDTLQLNLALVSRLGIDAACLEACLRQWLPAGEEKLIPLKALSSTLSFLNQEQILKALGQLQQHGRIQTGEGGHGLMPIALTAKAMGGDTASAPVEAAAHISRMTVQWQPGEDTLRLLTDAGISEEFWRGELDRFRIYYRERKQEHFWEYKFLSWVQRGWAEQPVTQPELPPLNDWIPSPLCLEDLRTRGVTEEALGELTEDFMQENGNLTGTPGQIAQRFSRFVLFHWRATYQPEADTP